MVEAATEFRKNGFNDDDSAILATVASKFSNVADEAISAGESASFIISQMIAFNIEAENAESIIDKVNEVANSFSVSSGNLSTALGIVASTSAAMGNSLDETLGIVTAITEQTRNASKSARAANTIFARLAQVVDENSDTGKQLTEIYNDLDISLYDATGQMRSTYDILHDLSKEWGSLDKNTQQYIAITSAGTNQLNNFLALMNNFDHAVKATETSMNSAGSAARENARYMEGLDARVSQLKATFQDLANNVIDNELVGSLLDLANKGLSVLNTGFGQTLVQIGLLTGLGWGATSLSKATKIFSTAKTQFANLIPVFKNLGFAIKGLQGSMLATAGAASMALPIIAAISAGIVGIVAAVKAINNAVEANKIENLTAKFNSANEAIDDYNQKLDEARKKLQELENQSIGDRADDWADERAQLEYTIERYEYLLQLQENERKKTAEKIGRKDVATGAVTVSSSTYGGIEVGQYKSESAAVYGLAGSLGIYAPKDMDPVEEIDYLKKKLQQLGYVFTEVTTNGREFNNQLHLQASNYLVLTKNVDDMTDAQKAEVKEWVNSNSVRIEALKRCSNLTEGEKGLISAYDILSERVADYTSKEEAVNNNTKKTTQSWLSRTSYAIKLKNATDEARVALANEIAQEAIFNNSSINVQAKVARLQELATAAGGAASAIAMVGAVSNSDIERTAKGMLATGAAKTYEEAIQKQLQIMWKSMFNFSQEPKTTTTTTSGSTTTSTTPAWVKQAEAAFAKLEHMRNMDLISEEEYYAELNRLNEKYYAGKSDYLDKYWSYQEKYYQWQRDQEKAALRAVLQAQVDKLNAQKDTLDKIASAAQKQIDDRLSELNDQLDEINAKYDAELEALEAQNDAFDDQINKEKLLQNLAKAQATMKYVFKDGRFQYVQDTDAVSDAKADLAEFEREQALKKAKEEIEERRQLALKDVQDEINHWQQLSDIWNNYTADYENSINMQLYLQKYGMEMEGLTFEQRLAQARQFVNEYNATMASLSNAQASLDRFDSSYTAGQSTEDQLKALKDEYWAARERNDAAGMESANRRANIIRGLGDVVTANVAIEAAKKRAISGEAGLKRPYASGTMSATLGLHLVGEQGPELRVLNKGDGILSADMTRNLYKMATAPQLFMQQAAGGGNTNISVANITLPNVRNAQDFLDGLRNMAYQRAYARA